VVLGRRFGVHPAVGLVIAGVLLTAQAAYTRDGLRPGR